MRICATEPHNVDCNWMLDSSYLLRQIIVFLMSFRLILLLWMACYKVQCFCVFYSSSQRLFLVLMMCCLTVQSQSVCVYIQSDVTDVC